MLLTIGERRDSLPHHVTQRGNRREPVFFEVGDYDRYLAFLTQSAQNSGTQFGRTAQSVSPYCGAKPPEGSA